MLIRQIRELDEALLFEIKLILTLFSLHIIIIHTHGTYIHFFSLFFLLSLDVYVLGSKTSASHKPSHV